MATFRVGGALCLVAAVVLGWVLRRRSLQAQQAQRAQQAQQVQQAQQALQAQQAQEALKAQQALQKAQQAKPTQPVQQAQQAQQAQPVQPTQQAQQAQQAQPTQQAQQAQQAQPTQETCEDMICGEVPAAPRAPPEASARAWPSIVHVLHDDGLAAELALSLSASATFPRGVSLNILSCSDFKRVAWTNAMRHTVIFIVSTLENEAPTEVAGQCYRFFLRKSHPAGLFAGKLAYAVLGLGDSNLLLDRQTTTAKDCNRVAQSLDRRLLELGATPICPRGESDERTGNTEIEPWLRTLESALAAACAVGEHSGGICTAECCCNIAGRNRIRVPYCNEL